MNLQLLKNKNFILLMIGNLISYFGNNSQNFALSLYVLDLTGSSTRFASILAVSSIPRILLGPFCGVIADWFDNKKTMVILDFLSGTFILTMLVVTGGKPELGHIYIIVFTLSFISSLYNPVSMSIIPQLFRKEDLMSANSINSVTNTICSFLAPTLAATLYAFVGIKVILLINGISYIVASFLEIFIKLKAKNIHKISLTFSRFKDDFMSGINYIRKIKILIYIFTAVFAINFVYGPVPTVGIVHLMRNVFKVSEIEFGMAQSMTVIGTIMAPFILGILKRRLKLKQIFYLDIGFLGFMILMTSVVSANLTGDTYVSYKLLSLILILNSGTVTLVNIVIATLKQQNIEIEYMGRVIGLSSTIGQAAMPLGQLIYGLLLDSISVWIPFFVSGVTMIVIALVFRRKVAMVK